MNLNTSINLPKIKISVRIIAVLLVIIAVLCYWYVFKNIIPEIEKEKSNLEAEISTMQAKEAELAKLYEDMPYYLEETDRLNNETEEILTEFPTFMYLEDKILYADTLLKTDFNGYNIREFSYGQSIYKMNVVYGSASESLELYSVALTAKYTDTTYTQVKDILDYGLSSDQRFVISNITMNYNEESGYISGEFTFFTYFIPGQTDPYVFPESVIVGLGKSDRTDDLFGARQTPVYNDR